MLGHPYHFLQDFILVLDCVNLGVILSVYVVS